MCKVLTRLGVFLLGLTMAGGAVAQQAATIEEIGGSSNQSKQQMRTLTQKGTPASTTSTRTSTTTSIRPQTAHTRTGGGLEDRVTRLERKVDNKALVNMMRRLNEVQQENEALRSEIEELMHLISGLKSRQRDIYNDIDRRMQQLEGRPSAGTSQAQPAAGAGDAADVRKAYEQAFAVLRKKQYDEAIKQFQDLVSRYPQSSYAGNAIYWLGEANRVTRRYAQAVSEFNTLINTYPKSAKVASGYLKLGISQYQLGNYKEAKKAFQTVEKKYPNTSSARLAKEELKKLAKERR